MANNQTLATSLTLTNTTYALVLLAAGILAARGYRRTGSGPAGLLATALILLGLPVSLAASGLIWLIWQPYGRPIDPGTGQSIVGLSFAANLLQSLLTLAGYLLLCVLAVQLARAAAGHPGASWKARWQGFALRWLS